MVWPPMNLSVGSGEGPSGGRTGGNGGGGLCWAFAVRRRQLRLPGGPRRLGTGRAATGGLIEFAEASRAQLIVRFLGRLQTGDEDCVRRSDCND